MDPLIDPNVQKNARVADRMVNNPRLNNESPRTDR